MPRSKSRATVRSLVSAGFSRWPMPGGRTQVSVSRSYSQAAVRSPRLALSAWWIGLSTWSRMKTAPVAASGPVRLSAPALHRADEHAGRDREHGGQHPAQDEHDPPRHGQRRGRPWAVRRRASRRSACDHHDIAVGLAWPLPGRTVGLRRIVEDQHPVDHLAGVRRHERAVAGVGERVDRRRLAGARVEPPRRTCAPVILLMRTVNGRPTGA